MKPEFSGIERRLERLSGCLAKLEPPNLYSHLQRLEELHEFALHIRRWLEGREGKG